MNEADIRVLCGNVGSIDFEVDIGIRSTENESDEEEKHNQEPDTADNLVELPLLCTQVVHCPICDFLIGSNFVSTAEVEAHGCCGQETCIAFPDDGEEDLLEPILTSHLIPNGDNNGWRKFVFRNFFGASARAGLLPDRSTTVNNKTRYLFSACVLHRVRCAYPDVEYMGFRST